MCKDVFGGPVVQAIPSLIDRIYRGTLLSRILAMPERTPIAFEAAINLVNESLKTAFAGRRIGTERGEYFWYTAHFIEFISELGYHIQLSGDEFEAYAITDKLA